MFNNQSDNTSSVSEKMVKCFIAIYVILRMLFYKFALFINLFSYCTSRLIAVYFVVDNVG